MRKIWIFPDADGLTEGIALILKHLQNQFGDILRQRLQGAVSVLLVVVLCAALENTGGKQPLFLSMAGALSITVLTAGSLDMLIGLGAETIQELNLFSKALLPTLAAATAASGAITTATFQQVSTVFFADLADEPDQRSFNADGLSLHRSDDSRRMYVGKPSVDHRGGVEKSDYMDFDQLSVTFYSVSLCGTGHFRLLWTERP